MYNNNKMCELLRFNNGKWNDHLLNNDATEYRIRLQKALAVVAPHKEYLDRDMFKIMVMYVMNELKEQ